MIHLIYYGIILGGLAGNGHMAADINGSYWSSAATSYHAAACQCHHARPKTAHVLPFKSHHGYSSAYNYGVDPGYLR